MPKLKAEKYRGKKINFWRGNDKDVGLYVNATWQNVLVDRPGRWEDVRVTGKNKKQAFNYAKKEIDKLFIKRKFLKKLKQS